MPFRLLNDREIIQAGDEFLEDDCEGWRAVNSGFPVGQPHNASVFKPARRFELHEPPAIFGSKKLAIT